jgi:hypothetical protein
MRAVVLARRWCSDPAEAFAMISWLPDDVLRAACQMACLGFAALTAVVTFLLTPRW